MNAQQLNFIEQLEKQENERQWRERQRKLYEQWKALPESVLVKDGSLKRNYLVYEASNHSTELWGQALHECPGLPPDEYIWLNHNYPPGDEFWVLQEKGEVGGERISTCPYCNADLQGSRGDVRLIKAEARHWEWKLKRMFPEGEGRETNA